MMLIGPLSYWEMSSTPTPDVDHGGGYGPIIRWRHHDDEGDIIAVIAAYVQSQED